MGLLKFERKIMPIIAQRLWERACSIQDEAFWAGDEKGFKWALADLIRYEQMMGENPDGITL